MLLDGIADLGFPQGRLEFCELLLISGMLSGFRQEVVSQLLDMAIGFPKDIIVSCLGTSVETCEFFNKGGQLAVWIKTEFHSVGAIGSFQVGKFAADARFELVNF